MARMLAPPRDRGKIPESDRTFLLEALMGRPATRAGIIGNLNATGLVPETVELLIDAEADLAVRALAVGQPREA
jgi:hypothetical protein